MDFHPYLNFDGTCRAAFTWYQGIFGGELTILGPEVAGGEIPEGFADRVIHAALVMPSGALLMASDTQPGEHKTPQGTYVNVATANAEQARRVWNELAEGALSIESPLQEVFFSPAFGVLVDRYGTPWMVSAASPDSPGA